MRKGLLGLMFLVSAAACTPPHAREDASVDTTAPPVQQNGGTYVKSPAMLLLEQRKEENAKLLQGKVPDLVFGDSNAHGMRTKFGLEGGTKIGNGPKSILDSLQAWPREDLEGKVILLTTGAGNDPSQVDDYVPRQLQYLKDSKPAAVIVMGISETHTKTDGKAMNVRLQAFAKQYGFVYGGPILETAQDHIHAKSYGKLFQQAQDSLNNAVSVPVAPVKKYSGADLIFGDSNAHGMRTLKEREGGTKIGNGPKSVLDSIQAWPHEDLKGKIIFLTTGASNNTDQIDEYVPQQLKYLKEAGVAGIVVMGMSEKQANADGAAANVKIKAYAQKYGFTYGGAIRDLAPDNVHARSYDQLYRQALNALNAHVSVPAKTPATKLPGNSRR